MIPSDAFLDEIEAYEEGRLSTPQRRAVEQRIQTDPAFRAALTEYRVFRHSLEAVDLKRRLASIHQELETSGALREPPLHPYGSAPRRVALWRWVAAASVVLLGVGVWGWWPRTAAPTASQTVYATFYQPEPVMRGGTECPPDFAALIGQYRAGLYEPALRALKTHSDSEPCTPYYRGLCQLALHQPEAAIASLDTARRQSTGSLRQRAEWYLALAYLSHNDIEAGRAQLRGIVREAGHPFGGVAGGALEGLGQ